MHRLDTYVAGAVLCCAAAGLLPAQNLLVSSRNTDQVLAYDPAGSPLGVFASGGGLDNPVGLTFGPDGDLYVASGDSDAILRYDGRTGAFVRVVAQGGPLRAPRNLNFGPGGDLYVCSGGTNQVLRYDGTSGAFDRVFAQHAQLDGPTSLTFGPDLDLYVGSVRNSRVLRFDGASGVFLGAVSGGGLNGTHDVAFGPDGHLYVSNAFSHDVVRFDGRTLAPLGTFVQDPALRFPLGLWWDRAGDLLIANQGNHDVRRYDGATGALLGVLVASRAGGLNGPLFGAFVRGPGGVVQRAPTPPGAGHDVAVVAVDARAGGLVATAIGIIPGNLPLPCPGQFLGIGDPLTLGFGIADEGGRLVLRAFAPAAIAGVTVRLQSVDLTGCSASAVVVHAF